MRRFVSLGLVVLLLGGCGKTAEAPAQSRPEWRGATIDGLAPLMYPPEVAAALARNGYVQVPCPSKGKLLPRPLYAGDARPCFRSPGRPMTVSLYFLDLHEGRRLAVVNFNRHDRADTSEAERVGAGSALARRLRARFGRPAVTVEQLPDYRSFYWNRPGGRAEQPDTISTTVSRDLSPGITMTSMWAYGQVRADAR